MNNEIKEILELQNKTDEIKNDTYTMKYTEWKAILDYITNLQEENKNIKLEQTKKVFDTLADLISENETCSYRFLIYDLLGFDCSAYGTLLSGLVITNALVELEDYKSRIDKAVEYMKKWGEEPDADMYMQMKQYEEFQYLLNILKGEDKE